MPDRKEEKILKEVGVQILGNCGDSYSTRLQDFH